MDHVSLFSSSLFGRKKETSETNKHAIGNDCAGKKSSGSLECIMQLIILLFNVTALNSGFQLVNDLKLATLYVYLDFTSKPHSEKTKQKLHNVYHILLNVIISGGITLQGKTLEMKRDLCFCHESIPVLTY